MPDQDEIRARKAASVAGAGDNSQIGTDGDDASVADAAEESSTGTGADPRPDPVTGTTDKAVGTAQAAENADREPAG